MILSIASLPALVLLPNTPTNDEATLRRVIFLHAPLYRREQHQQQLSNSSPCGISDIIQQQEQQLSQLHQRKFSSNADLVQCAESLVDTFLVSQYQFSPDAIPWDYLDTPPARLDIVQHNLNTLLHVTSDVFLPSSPVAKELIIPFVARAWDNTLTPLRRELMQQREIMLGVMQQQQQAAGGASSSSVLQKDQQRCQKIVTELNKDLLYLDRIFKLEEFHEGGTREGGTGGPQELGGPSKDVMSDFVTMSGIMIGRLHRLENEHRTVLEHWATKRL